MSCFVIDSVSCSIFVVFLDSITSVVGLTHSYHGLKKNNYRVLHKHFEAAIVQQLADLRRSKPRVEDGANSIKCDF